MKKRSDNSPPREVSSNQQGLHPNLNKIVVKHLHHPFLKPYAQHNIDAFNIAEKWIANRPQALILDSFCGTGESTRQLARLFPQSLVIGVDKSAARLNRHQLDNEKTINNYLLVRADIDDFWRLAVERRWILQHHFLLYPNPWPKSAQLQYRVHGSAVFPALLTLGGEVTLRSNWKLYVDEFAKALTLSGNTAETTLFHPVSAITPFERKYHLAGQPLWECNCKLNTSQ
ncbi:tRNA (guanine-N(7)-)-methyltransferase [Zhongshania aliphaticivorans]|uniref:tRNA (guanine(46)-N(7))-methyltransferase n=1 Tax=Zhongshania aliphaticivorans TaxID=1470434 RepID=A0A5S9N4L6_9GAMM|nr:methyltransferase domain-containing protein [Zhongshania aliphaticivorans]CAA0082781.1 tRNA (guanine-N(7)-)-methyltransferase [Zhongshania aliphaticivorans]CAA0084008.1 tRNA (guanine-N(7)-)-methyltransferase [Zhongshania aliphaticivorans]